MASHLVPDNTTLLVWGLSFANHGLTGLLSVAAELKLREIREQPQASGSLLWLLDLLGEHLNTVMLESLRCAWVFFRAPQSFRCTHRFETLCHVLIRHSRLTELVVPGQAPERQTRRDLVTNSLKVTFNQGFE